MRLRTVLLSALSLCILFPVAVIAEGLALTPNEELGKAIFFDPDLSINGNQSCADCHGTEVGFTGPKSLTNGAVQFTKDQLLAALATGNRPAQHTLH